MNPLPSELISLVHHVQLNQQGWWEKAMERLILATLWTCGRPLHPSEVPKEILRQYSVRVEDPHVQRVLDRLLTAGTLVPLSGKVKVSEQRLAEFERDRKESERLENGTKQRFIKEFSAVSVTEEPDQLWNTFAEKWLRPTVCSLGARTYELINGKYEEWFGGQDIRGFLQSIPEDQHAAVREAVGRFLDPTDPDVRGYLLRMMDAYFIVEASTLSESTLNGLNKITGTQPSFVVFLDTNFILSVLGLHGEVKKEAAKLLLALTKRLEGRVDITLYVLPQTIDETRAALEGELFALKGLRLTPKLAGVAVQSRHLEEVALAYAEAVVKAGSQLSPDQFLGPYLRDPLVILRSHGIELFNTPAEDYANRGDVLQDVETQMKAQKKKPGLRPKSRAQLIHDTALWYVAQDRRQDRVESPLDARYWVVTEDFRLTAFDVSKRKRQGVPVAVHPLTLVQILQFWIGRTEGMEQALLGGLRLSLAAPEFDQQAEKATLRILSALSRYQNLDDLPLSAMSGILLNDALRQRMAGKTTDAEKEELVQNQILEELRRVSEENARAQQEASHLRTELDSARQTAQERGRHLTSRVEDAENKLAKATSQIAEHERQLKAHTESERLRDEQQRELEKQLHSQAQESRHLSDTLQQKTREWQIKGDRNRFLRRWVLSPAMLLAVGVVLLARAHPPSLLADWRLSIPMVAIFLAGWAWLAWWVGGKDNNIRDWQVYSIIDGTKKAVLYVLGAVLLSVVGNAVYDAYKPLARGVAPAGTGVDEEQLAPSQHPDSTRADSPSKPPGRIR